MPGWFNTVVRQYSYHTFTHPRQRINDRLKVITKVSVVNQWTVLECQWGKRMKRFLTGAKTTQKPEALPEVSISDSLWKLEPWSSFCTVQAAQQAARLFWESLSAVLTVYIILRLEELSGSRPFQEFPETIEVFTSSVLKSFFAEWNASSPFRLF